MIVIIVNYYYCYSCVLIVCIVTTIINISAAGHWAYLRIDKNIEACRARWGARRE